MNKKTFLVEKHLFFTFLEPVERKKSILSINLMNFI